MDAHNIIAYLIRVSEEKLQFMHQILSLTKEQSSCTNEEKLDQMMDLIHRKQLLIDKVNMLDREFEEKYDALKKYCNVASLEEIEVRKYEGIKELKNAVHQIYDIIEKIRQLEAQNNENMQKALEAVKQELSQVRNNIKINHTYGKNKNLYGGVFIDKKK